MKDRALREALEAGGIIRERYPLYILMSVDMKEIQATIKALLDHLELEVVNAPSKVVVRKKEGGKNV